MKNDRLFIDAVEMAKRILMDTGKAEGVVLGVSKDGELCVIPCTYQSNEEKQAFFSKVKQEFIARKVIKYVTISEGWMVTATSPEEVANISPSTHPNKVECLVAMGISFTGRAIRTFIIRRNSTGKVIGLESSEIMEGDGVQGEMAEFLTKIPEDSFLVTNGSKMVN